MTYRLIYKSKASPDVTDADYRTIAMFSSLWNKRHSISGLLLQYNDQIMQVLEGPEKAVKDLYARIERDKRHYDVSVELSRECKEPIFQEWSMGYRPLESAEQMEAFFVLTRENLEAAIPESASEDLRQVLGDFASAAGVA